MVNHPDLEFLQIVVEALRASHIQVKDVLSRVSSSELAILKNNATHVEVIQWLSNFRADLTFTKHKEQSVSINIGVAILNPYILDVSTICDAAKNAVLDAKKLGPNESVFSQGSLPKKV
jgi:GGDEF domain-containing protein